jgi:mono/diheme cytochrome c family protein
MKTQRKLAKILGLLGLFILLVSCQQKKEKSLEEIVENQIPIMDLVEHGKYMVDVLGCADCHTPKKMTDKGPVFDMEKYLMGYDASQDMPPVPENVPIGPWVLFKGDLTAAVGPWGTSYAGNLTPHGTGIGNWTLEQFTKVLREAKFKGMDNTRPIMPPMPTNYANLKDEDIEAIFVYLKSIKPIENVVPGYQPPTS